MNLFLKKDLIGLPVETRSGMPVGKLIDVEIDQEAHLVANYQVKATRLLPGLFSKSLMVSRQQIVSVSKEKIVVEDNVLKEKAGVFEPAKKVFSVTESAQ